MERIDMRSCLVVDDSKVIRKVARHILETLNFAVDEAEDGREALTRCEAAMPDVILLDWNMPVMSGMEFLRALRQTELAAQPKVVFCTTENDIAHIRAAIEAGADEYVMKPFDRDTLQSKLQIVGVA
jgi:two-component system chemotaxis response regulator CheY